MPETVLRSGPRATQAERRNAMRAKLLEATLSIIVEQGWSRTSTQKICARAGVSRGAQTHHFPTKESLLIAAVTEMVARYQKQFESALRDGSEPPSLAELFDFLWDACFEGELLNTWMEAMVAARTDQQLRDVVRSTDEHAIRAMRQWGETSDRRSDAADLVELTVYLLRGMVVQSGVHPDNRERARLFDVWKRVVLKS